ncbi:hypothetical protein [Rhodoferax sp.]|uniref:hypothetical protein n=1 Tax=Rhodoferax sp. TaxID=50421 RepID=UPI0025F71C3F|nr:hypothetical protein [Rhodoferax sp.]MCM2341301.1 hypothetical protein [Rhodoferax sp.]
MATFSPSLSKFEAKVWRNYRFTSCPCRQARRRWSIWKNCVTEWLTESVKAKDAGYGCEDWSQDNSDVALIEHVRSRVDDYLAFATINRVLAEFHALDRVYAHQS